MSQAVSVANLWQESHAKLLAFIRGRVRSREDAEDILQEVFARVQAHLPSLRSAKCRNGWLYQIARSVLAGYYRILRRSLPRPAASEAQLESEDLSHHGSAGCMEDPGMRLGRGLQCLVARLPEPYREALQLTEVQGFSQVVAAERLELSVSGMKSRVQREGRSSRSSSCNAARSSRTLGAA